MIDKIELRIRQLGIKKSHLAKVVGMSPSELSHILSNRRNLQPDQETKIRNYLGL